VYEHCDKKVCIIDPVYGEFWQTPYQHLKTYGCKERVKNKEWLIHTDHIIPIAICSQSRKTAKWVINRPLYKFLNSEINLQEVDAKFNREKSQTVIINGKIIKAADIRNNYEAIEYLCRTLLNADVSDIIKEDKEYVTKFLFDK
jgi:spore germination protein YaaH